MKKIKNEKEVYMITPGIIPTRKFEYDNLPFCESLNNDFEIKHKGLKAIGEFSLLVLIESVQWWIPRNKISYIDKKILTVRRDFAEQIGFLKK